MRGGEPELLAPAALGDALGELAVPGLEADVAQRMVIEALEHVAVGALLLQAREGDEEPGEELSHCDPFGLVTRCRLRARGIADISCGKQFVSGLYNRRTQMDSVRVLVVDDDPAIREMLAEYLGGHGYTVALAAGGAAMRVEIERARPAVVLLDVGLPGEDGLTLARYLREHYHIGIIMVTGAADVVDRVAGLEVGADDYIAKPFDPRELRARLKSVLRRVQAAAPAAPVERKGAGAELVGFGACRLNLRSRQLTDAKGREVPLTAMEFTLLKAFLDRPNQVLSRDQLLTLTRNREWEPFDRSIDIRIARLRRKVEADPARPRAIKTVRGGGYMYVPLET
jgi:DNA-binding response OmpR family regulator